MNDLKFELRRLRKSPGFTMPGVFPVVASALVLLAVAVGASIFPARVDVIQALHTE